ncbi:MAG: DUF58 domain-containing protein [Pseudomonadota bacterium]
MSSTAWLSRRLSHWVRRRQGVDSLPLTLSTKRLYILPTRVGMTFGLVAFAMLLGSMNYNNSMGFALTFLLTAAGLVAMHRCHQNLSGLILSQLYARRAFAGEPITVELTLNNQARTPRFDLRARVAEYDGGYHDVPPAGSFVYRIRIPTQQRGRLQIERIGLATEFPLGLLQTWAWLYVDAECLVWPKPAEIAPARPALADDGAGQRGSGGDEDFAGLRDYQDGDSPRLIAWKTYARTHELQSRQYDGQNTSEVWLDFASLSHLPAEEALSVMARWILDAEKRGEQYGLRLPDATQQPANGLRHRNQCLDALACYGNPEPRRAS